MITLHVHDKHERKNVKSSKRLSADSACVVKEGGVRAVLCLHER